MLVTDGNSGVGESSLKKSLQSFKEKSNKTNNDNQEDKFPLPYPFPCKLNIVCITPPEDKHLKASMPHYEKLIEINKSGGQVYIPEGNLTAASVQSMFQKLADDYFMPFLLTLKCGNMKCPVQLFPAPDSFAE